MSLIPLIIFERRGRWAEQLRPRLQHRPVRIREARSAADCRRTLRGVRGSLAVLDLTPDPLAGLRALEAILDVDAQATVLVLAGRSLRHLAPLMLELGATHFVAEPPDPDVLAGWLDRFLSRATLPAGGAAAPEAHGPVEESG